MVELGFLSFMAEPWLVLPWFGIGAVGALWVVADAYGANTRVSAALKWAWPIIVFFFSVPGWALYRFTCRPPGIGRLTGEEEKRVYHAFVTVWWRRVAGSVIHCVGGDGLGIVTAMIVARLIGMGFWQEFWFEYAVGFCFGWFIFQAKATSRMSDGLLTTLWLGGRAEFFSMLTVMAGMGAVMGYVTPLAVGQQPMPTTFAFWSFAALGLMVGFVVTFPMNAWLVRIGWKHGMS